VEEKGQEERGSVRSFKKINLRGQRSRGGSTWREKTEPDAGHDRATPEGGGGDIQGEKNDKDDVLLPWSIDDLKKRKNHFG